MWFLCGNVVFSKLYIGLLLKNFLLLSRKKNGKRKTLNMWILCFMLKNGNENFNTDLLIGNILRSAWGNKIIVFMFLANKNLFNKRFPGLYQDMIRVVNKPLAITAYRPMIVLVTLISQ